MHPPVLDRATWTGRAAAHEARVDRWIVPHLQRRRRGQTEPVLDFLFDYYAHRPGHLRRWGPGYGTELTDAPEYRTRSGYLTTTRGEVMFATVDAAQIHARADLIAATRALLAATASRPATLGCFGLHEWAMVYRSDRPRHPIPLRLGAAGTDEVVESHNLVCSHFDAYRFFTEAARPLNALTLRAAGRIDAEQPGCLHAGMDLYKHAFRLSPLVPADLVADCFDLAQEIRVLDMRASPYDLSEYGYEPVAIETPAGKQQYIAAQRGFSRRAAPLRQRLLDWCDLLLTTHRSAGG